MQDTAQSSAAQGRWLTTTHWSLDLNAHDPSGPEAGEALEKLCRAYGYPLCAFARRQGHDERTAKDLTPGFFAKRVGKNHLEDLRCDKGKFSSFLLASMRHFMSDQRDKATAVNRGGGQPLTSLDHISGEDRYRREPADLLGTEKIYEQTWVITLLEKARERLREECRAAGKTALYEHWQRSASVDVDAVPHPEAVPALGLSVSGLRTVVHRMSHRYREIAREEVAQTVNSPAEVDEELRYLLRVAGG